MHKKWFAVVIVGQVLAGGAGWAGADRIGRENIPEMRKPVREVRGYGTMPGIVSQGGLQGGATSSYQGDKQPVRADRQESHAGRRDKQ